MAVATPHLVSSEGPGMLVAPPPARPGPARPAALAGGAPADRGRKPPAQAASTTLTPQADITGPTELCPRPKMHNPPHPSAGGSGQHASTLGSRKCR